MILTFADEDTEAFFREGRRPRRGWQNLMRIAARKLDLLNAATSLTDLASPPDNRLERLSGDRDGQHSIRINDQYRVCFLWTDAGATAVEVVDYH